MSTEARIGIVAGLVIVVVASLYFFYGSDKEEADMLVSAGPQVSTPPKIPAAADKKTSPASPSAAKAPATPAGRPPHAAPGAVGAPTASNPPRPGAPLPAGMPRTGTGDAPAPGRPPLVGSTGSTAAAPNSVALVGPPEPRPGADWNVDSGLRLSTPLRTGPSSGLVEATRENLRRDAGEDDEHPLEAGGAGGPAKTKTAGSSEPAAKSAAGRRGSSDTALKPSGTRATGAAADKPASSAETWPKKHVIAQGETLSGLADSYYGSSKSLPLILKANPQIKEPRTLKVGDVVTIPEPPKPAAPAPDESTARTATASPAAATPIPGREAKAAENTSAGDTSSTPDAAVATGADTTAAGGKTYLVREGDTFYSIAAGELGGSSRWTEIYKLNRELVKDDPKRLRPGMVVRLPME